MCRSPLHPLLQRLPKCEHHIHLEGALTPALLFSLATRNNIPLPQDDPAFASAEALIARYERFTSLDDFLHYYYIGMSVLVVPEDFEALAWDYFQRASADGVRHIEAFFDPQAHVSRGVSYPAVVAGFSAARERAARELGVSTMLTCCFLRHLPVDDSVTLLQSDEVQASFTSGAVAGIGVDSSEVPFPPHKFKALYEHAQARGLRRTAHAGEEGPASYIAEAIDVLGVERIDHGIHLADDAALVRRVADLGLLLTVCPLSNVRLRCVPSITNLPLQTFLDAGVSFSLNSDDPAYFGYIGECYCAVQEAFNLAVKDWESICRVSIEKSWCDQQRKDELLAELRTVTNDWEKTSAG